MLALKRFDCLALGANEVRNIFDEKKLAYPTLAMDQHLLIYYNFPIYFYISNKTPKLAQRMQSGLRKLQQSGEFYRLFYRHHGKKLAELNLKNRNIICLESAYSTTENQCNKPIVLPDL